MRQQLVSDSCLRALCDYFPHQCGVIAQFSLYRISIGNSFSKRNWTRRNHTNGISTARL